MAAEAKTCPFPSSTVHRQTQGQAHLASFTQSLGRSTVGQDLYGRELISARCFLHLFPDSKSPAPRVVPSGKANRYSQLCVGNIFSISPGFIEQEFFRLEGDVLGCFRINFSTFLKPAFVSRLDRFLRPFRLMTNPLPNP